MIQNIKQKIFISNCKIHDFMIPFLFDRYDDFHFWYTFIFKIVYRIDKALSKE